jgi:hypothetical protein
MSTPSLHMTEHIGEITSPNLRTTTESKSVFSPARRLPGHAHASGFTLLVRRLMAIGASNECQATPDE